MCILHYIWFFILKQLVISIISFLQLKLSRSPRAAVSATRCLDFAFFRYLHQSITVPLEVTWPPPQTNSRVGGYDFLGGEAEVWRETPAASWARAPLKKRLYTFLDFLDFLGWTVWVLLQTSSSNGYPKLSRCAICAGWIGAGSQNEPEWARMSQNEPETIQRPWARPSC